MYQRFINPNPSPARIVLVQRVAVLGLGLLAYLALTQFTTVLAMAFTAYTMVGAGITPALLAAFLWKRVTAAGGVASIATGMGVTLSITVANSLMAEPLLSPTYISIPASSASILVLVTVSLLTAPSPETKWRPFHTK